MKTFVAAFLAFTLLVLSAETVVASHSWGSGSHYRKHPYIDSYSYGDRSPCTHGQNSGYCYGGDMYYQNPQPVINVYNPYPQYRYHYASGYYPYNYDYYRYYGYRSRYPYGYYHYYDDDDDYYYDDDDDSYDDDDDSLDDDDGGISDDEDSDDDDGGSDDDD